MFQLEWLSRDVLSQHKHETQHLDLRPHPFLFFCRHLKHIQPDVLRLIINRFRNQPKNIPRYQFQEALKLMQRTGRDDLALVIHQHMTLTQTNESDMNDVNTLVRSVFSPSEDIAILQFKSIYQFWDMDPNFPVRDNELGVRVPYSNLGCSLWMHTLVYDKSVLFEYLAGKGVDTRFVPSNLNRTATPQWMHLADVLLYHGHRGHFLTRQCDILAVALVFDLFAQPTIPGPSPAQLLSRKMVEVFAPSRITPHFQQTIEFIRLLFRAARELFGFDVDGRYPELVQIQNEIADTRESERHYQSALLVYFLDWQNLRSWRNFEAIQNCVDLGGRIDAFDNIPVTSLMGPYIENYGLDDLGDDTFHFILARHHFSKQNLNDFVDQALMHRKLALIHYLYFGSQIRPSIKVSVLAALSVLGACNLVYELRDLWFRTSPGSFKRNIKAINGIMNEFG
ncbi:hypothetical protein HK102_003441 [Quaeritorhiza haematococci]|nr:hypothetical protein HK102_003441 [Quaeritorhiza haematococci]